MTLIAGCVINKNWEDKIMKKKKQKNNTGKRNLKELTPAQLKKLGGAGPGEWKPWTPGKKDRGSFV